MLRNGRKPLLASVALYGLAYRAFPELQRGWTAKGHLILSGISGPLLPLGIYLAIFKDDATLTRIAAPMWFIGAIIFLVSLLRLLLAKQPASAAKTVPAMAE